MAFYRKHFDLLVNPERIALCTERDSFLFSKSAFLFSLSSFPAFLYSSQNAELSCTERSNSSPSKRSNRRNVVEALLTGKMQYDPPVSAVDPDKAEDLLLPLPSDASQRAALQLSESQIDVIFAVEKFDKGQVDKAFPRCRKRKPLFPPQL